MQLPRLMLIVLAGATFAHAQPPGPVDVQPDGRGRAVIDWPRERPFAFDTWVVRDNWASIAHTWDVRDRQYTPHADGTRNVGGRLDLDKHTLTIDEHVTPDRVDYAFTNSAEAIPNVVGIYWVASLPTDAFAGGTVTVGERRFKLPREPHDPPQMGEATSDHVVVRSADGGLVVDLKFDAPHVVRVQDARAYKDANFQLLVAIAERPTLEAGAHDAFSVTFNAKIAAAKLEATVAVDASQVLNRFDGFGGNFVYATDDAATRFVLDALPAPAWARLGMDLKDWSTLDPKAASLRDRPSPDAPGSPLRKRFELDRELFRRTGGKVIASIWYPPEWLFADTKPYRDSPGKIPRDRWPAFCDCIVSYLTQLKTNYGVEPKYVSLNEPDWGVYVLQDGDEMRDWIKLLGGAMRDAGLSTRVLLGDVADLHRGWDVIQPTLADAGACAFVGAIAYHPWSGQNDAWPRWADVAAKHAWPLFATEMGADGEAWHDGSFDSPLYALRLATRDVEQLRDARTASILEWEWTGDFPMAMAANAGALKLTPRGQIVRQLAATTPTAAHVVVTRADASVIAAALVGGDGAMTVQVVARDAGSVRVTGLPTWATSARVARVDAIDGAREAEAVEVRSGACSLEVGGGELLSIVLTR